MRPDDEGEAVSRDRDADGPRVAVFRPDDDRLERAVEVLTELGADPVPDPMLAIEPTGASPREDTDYVILTSKTGVELAAEADWNPGTATVCAIGPATADALRDGGYAVDVVPETYTSRGLVDALVERGIEGASVEVARSDHGSTVLLDGLEAAGASVHETVLYRLVRPDNSGESAELAAEGRLDAVCFTSSLTVEHFLAAAAERGIHEAALERLADAVVGVIGEPTADTAAEHGIEADVVADTATFDVLARETVAAIPSHRA